MRSNVLAEKDEGRATALPHPASIDEVLASANNC